MRLTIAAGLVSGLVGSATAVQYGYNHVPLEPDSEIVSSAFKDVDVELLSPAFIDEEGRLPAFSEGTKGPSNQETMEDYLQDLASRNEYMAYALANFTSEEHRSLPYVRLSTSSSSSRKRAADGDDERVRVWIQAAVHGNEPAGDEAALALLAKFDAEPDWAGTVLDKLDIVVLPRYNPDGVFYFQRTLASNYDPNRDHIKLARRQTRDIKALFNAFNPHVVVDLHEYGSASTFADRYVHAADGLFSAAKNLNIDAGIRDLAEGLFAKNMGEAMEKNNLRWEPYVTGSSSDGSEGYVAEFAEAGTDAKIGRNAMGLAQTVTFLVETRGIGLADQQFQRRTASGLTMASSVIQTASDNASKVYRTIEAGRKALVESAGEEVIVVTDYSETSTRPFSMVDKTNGSVVFPPVLFASTTPAIANLTRPRPDAYLIPGAWADLAERLRVSGLEVETLKDGFEGAVETLTVASADIATEYYEGAVRVALTTEAGGREVKLPAGSFRVSARQQRAALAFVALEPENMDSYAAFNIVPLEEGDEYPVYRLKA
ncbi:hypothetical protein N3K66_006973 [Trichothecium roseum]|uniref:Uncharacterized protein n=1 Tax=Trichothecium roseum TaxID=47278 RepID=A0ACC0UXH7_9HYPO|nr:hypothetical protein N3K66_006973 [Trichothecium roseum]